MPDSDLIRLMDTFLLYQIGDIRMFYENDVRFLDQFKSVL